ncbi:extensin family protein [Aestuariivirga sp.]|uniref:extensin-like domain-containing protein n=1 Tax=Aestuariivirga sp. TaxID=2650926 RepID=UPI0039E66273
MRKVSGALALMGAAGLLAACSFSGHTNFETEGLIAPPQQCAVPPSTLGQAEKISRIDEGNGCEVPNPWRVYSLSTVQFSQPATLNCSMANPLNDWLNNIVQPAAKTSFGERVVAVDVLASYSCRPRNNVSGAKMSEHGFGNAIDIGAFTLEDGRKVTVLDGWYGRSDEQAFLREVRKDACGEFMTVLGPGSDSEHRNHIHLDLQQRRNHSTYCH